MSGDIQARKRKEKKRKKDEEDNVIPTPTTPNVSENLTDNVTIHIYKESSTGGHWCARIIFFVLLTILVGLIGVVIIENRGITNANTPLESSRWAYIFDGWVDDSLSLSDEEAHEGSKSIEDETKYNENVEVKSTETEVSGEEETEENDEEETEENDEEEIEENDEEEIEENDEISNEYVEQEDTIENNSDEEQREDFESGEENVDEELSHEEEHEDREEKKVVLEDEDPDSQEFDDADVLEEIYSISKEKNLDGNGASDETVNQFDEVLETPKDEDIFEKFSDIPGVNEITDNNIEPLEEVESIEPEEYVNDIDVKPEIEEIEEESASVAMKFGVGVALIIAAHFVLVKRWNNEVIFVLNESKLISSETEDVEEKIVPKNERIIKVEKYESERQGKTEKPEITKNKEEEIEMLGEDGDAQDEEEEEEEEEEEVEEVEEEEEEEEEDEEEFEKEDEEEENEEETEVNRKGNKMKQKDSSEEEEIEIFDDSELIAKLEAKYGKLQAIQNDNDEDSEHEKETRIKKLTTWKHN